jgi:hypothetical protein
LVEMNRRGKLTFIVVLVAGFGALGGYLAWPHEPTYLGKGLSAWLRDFDAEQMEKRVSAGDAVRHIGPKAVPFLVNRLEMPRPRPGAESRLDQWKGKVLGWLGKTTLPPGRRPDPRYQAMAGLDALGPAAKDALPALEKLLREDPPDPQALYVVARIGPAGLPILKSALTNEAKVLRIEARVCLDMIKTNSEDLYSETGSVTDAAFFVRRICEFHLKVINADYEDYRAQHPEPASPGGMEQLPPSIPPSPRVPQQIQNDNSARLTNSAKRPGDLPASRFE